MASSWGTSWSTSWANSWGQIGVSSAAVTADQLTEADIRSGGKTIVIELTSDTWVAAGATFNTQRQNIIDGLDSAQSELLGWNAEVRDKEVVGAVVRTSDTVVTITLTAAAAYDVTANESITVTVPATALVTSASAVIASPAVVVVADSDVVVEAPSGGWGAVNAYESYRQRKRRRKQELDVIAESIDGLEGVDAEIAQLLHADTKQAEQARQIDELEMLVATTFRNEDLAEVKERSERVAKAYVRAAQQGNYSAYRAFEREMERMLQDEELLLMAMALLT